MVQPRGIEPLSTDLQTAAMTTSAKVALVPCDRIELPEFINRKEKCFDCNYENI